jgi:hypothetical protein
VATLGRHGDRGLSARLPREQDGYAVYDLEQDVWADEARLRSRGLPGWAIVLAAATAVGLGFMALKVFLERRPALNFLASSTGISAPASTPVSTPMDTQPAVTAQGETGAPSLEPAPSAEPPPSSAAPAVVPVAEAVNKSEEEQQPVREQIAAQPPAPELSQKAAAKAHRAHEPRKAERKVAHVAPARAPKAAASAPKAEKPEPLTQVRGEKSAPIKSVPVAAKVEPPKPEPKAEARPVEAKKPAKPQSVADLAVQAASVATDNRPSKGAVKQAPNELDELMDNVLNSSKSEKSKKQKMTDDPIYGL